MSDNYNLTCTLHPRCCPILLSLLGQPTCITAFYMHVLSGLIEWVQLVDIYLHTALQQIHYLNNAACLGSREIREVCVVTCMIVLKLYLSASGFVLPIVNHTQEKHPAASSTQFPIPSGICYGMKNATQAFLQGSFWYLLLTFLMHILPLCSTSATNMQDVWLSKPKLIGYTLHMEYLFQTQSHA